MLYVPAPSSTTPPPALLQLSSAFLIDEALAPGVKLEQMFDLAGMPPGTPVYDQSVRRAAVRGSASAGCNVLAHAITIHTAAFTDEYAAPERRLVRSLDIIVLLSFGASALFVRVLFGAPRMSGRKTCRKGVV
jgi:hypothetical protein